MSGGNQPESRQSLLLPLDCVTAAVLIPAALCETLASPRPGLAPGKVTAEARPTMNRLRVLTYHRIAEQEAIRPLDPKLVSASPGEFARQMAWIAGNYTVIDMDTAIEAVERGSRLPRRALLITFDDAYPDFGTTAWPILKANGLPVTLFVPTDFPAQRHASFWWDALNARLANTGLTRLATDALGELPLATEADKRRAASMLRAHVKTMPHAEAMDWLDGIGRQLGESDHVVASTMTWDEIRGLSDDGVTIGAHSRSHALLTAIPPTQLDSEIAGSQEDIEREIGSTRPIFCYPAGAFNDDVEAAAARCGIRLGFTTLTGHNNLHRHRPLALKRLNVTPRTTLNLLKFKLSIPGARIDQLRKRQLR